MVVASRLYGQSPPCKPTPAPTLLLRHPQPILLERRRCLQRHQSRLRRNLLDGSSLPLRTIAQTVGQSESGVLCIRLHRPTYHIHNASLEAVAGLTSQCLWNCPVRVYSGSIYPTRHCISARYTTHADLEYQLDQLVCSVVPW